MTNYKQKALKYKLKYFKIINQKGGIQYEQVKKEAETNLEQGNYEKALALFELIFNFYPSKYNDYAQEKINEIKQILQSQQLKSSSIQHVSIPPSSQAVIPELVLRTNIDREFEEAKSETQWMSTEVVTNKYGEEILIGPYVNLEGANLEGANLSDANLEHANFSGANLSNANLTGANLTGVDLTYSNLKGANFEGAIFIGTKFPSMDFKLVNENGREILIGPEILIEDVDLSGTDLRHVNLSGANLKSVDLSGANLSNVDFTNANIYNSDFDDANLSGANLSKVNNIELSTLRNIYINKYTKFGDNVYEQVLVSVDKSDVWEDSENNKEKWKRWNRSLRVVGSKPTYEQGDNWDDNNYSFFDNTSDFWWDSLKISSMDNDIFNSTFSVINIINNIEVDNIEFKKTHINFLDRDDYGDDGGDWIDEEKSVRFENCTFDECEFEFNQMESIFFKNCIFVKSDIEFNNSESATYIWINNKFKHMKLVIPNIAGSIISSNEFFDVELEINTKRNTFNDDNIFERNTFNDVKLEINNHYIYGTNIFESNNFNNVEINDSELIFSSLEGNNFNNITFNNTNLLGSNLLGVNIPVKNFNNCNLFAVNTIPETNLFRISKPGSIAMLYIFCRLETINYNETTSWNVRTYSVNWESESSNKSFIDKLREYIVRKKEYFDMELLDKIWNNNISNLEEWIKIENKLLSPITGRLKMNNNIDNIIKEINFPLYGFPVPETWWKDTFKLDIQPFNSENPPEIITEQETESIFYNPSLKIILDLINKDRVYIETFLLKKDDPDLINKLIQNYKTIKTLIPFQIVKVCFTNTEIYEKCNEYIFSSNLQSGILIELRNMSIDITDEDFKQKLDSILPAFHDIFIKKREEQTTEWKGIKLTDLFKIFFNYLKGIDLSNKNLSNTNLSNTNLSNTNFTDSNLTGADLSRSDLSGSNLSNTNFTDSNLTCADLRDSNLTGANFEGTILIGTKFPKSFKLVVNEDDEEILIRPNTELRYTNLKGANLIRADLKGSNLEHTNFNNANLTFADLSNAKMQNAVLNSADLRYSNLEHTELWDVDLSDANLSNANLNFTRIGNTNLKGVDLRNAIIGFNMNDIESGDENIFDKVKFNEKTKLVDENYKLIYNNNDIIIIGPHIAYNSTKIDLKNLNLLEEGLNNLSFSKFCCDSDFSNTNFKGVDLSNINFTKCNLSGADLSGADLSYNVKFENSNLTNINFAETTDIYELSFYGSDLTGADLSNLNLENFEDNGENLDFRGAKLLNAKLPNFTYSNYDSIKYNKDEYDIIIKCDYERDEDEECEYNEYSSIKIVGPNFDLSNVDLRDYKLDNINLSGVNLSNANLSGVNLTGANLSDVNLTGANLTGTNLTNTNFKNAILKNSKLHSFKGKPINLSNNYQFIDSSYLIELEYEYYEEYIFGKNKENNFILGKDIDLSNSHFENVELPKYITRIDINGSVGNWKSHINGSFYRDDNDNKLILTNRDNEKNILIYNDGNGKWNINRVNFLNKLSCVAYKNIGESWNEIVNNEVNVAVWNENESISMNTYESVNLREYNLQDAKLINIDLKNADLGDTNLENAKIKYTDLRDANLTNANLENASLIGCNLTGVDLTLTNLKNAVIYDIKLKELPKVSSEYIIKKYNSEIFTANNHQQKYSLLIEFSRYRTIPDKDDVPSEDQDIWEKTELACILHKSINETNFIPFETNAENSTTINYSDLYIDIESLNDDDIILLQGQNINFTEEIYNFINNNLANDIVINKMKEFDIDWSELLFTAQKKNNNKIIEFVKKNDLANEIFANKIFEKSELIKYFKNKYIEKNQSRRHPKVLDFITKNDNEEFVLHYNYDSIFDVEDISKIILYTPYLALLIKNEKYGYYGSILHMCVRELSDSFVISKYVARFYIENGVNIDIKDKNGYTPLHFADKDWEIAEFLIKNGANVNSQNNNGDTPLHTICVNSFDNRNDVAVNIIDLLLKNGANVNIQNKDGNTPLHMITTYDNRYAGSIIDLLLKNGANVNSQNKDGNTPLHIMADASFHNRNAGNIIDLLLENGADINITNLENKKPSELVKISRWRDFDEDMDDWNDTFDGRIQESHPNYEKIVNKLNRIKPKPKPMFTKAEEAIIYAQTKPDSDSGDDY